MPKQQTKYYEQWAMAKTGSKKDLWRDTFCNKGFQVGDTGVIQVDSHARSDGHKAKIPRNSQRTLCALLQVDSLAPQLRLARHLS